MSAQSDHGSGASDAISPAQQRRQLDLSANDPTFESDQDYDEPDFVLTSSDPDFVDFLLERTQLAISKDVKLTPHLRRCLEDIEQHELHAIFDVEVAYKAIDMLLGPKDRPPTIAQIKQLPSVFTTPTKDRKCFLMVYIGILEKKGQIPHVYIGATFNLSVGSQQRISAYNHMLKLFPVESEADLEDTETAEAHAQMAAYFNQLLLAGYRMTSMHALFRIPFKQESSDLKQFTFGAAPQEEQARINDDKHSTAPQEGQVKPNDGAIPLPQLLVTYLQAHTKVLEAVSTMVLWAFWRGQRSHHASDHYLRDGCPFDIDKFEYLGVCSHSPLSKGISGYMLTEADLEARKARMIEKSKRFQGPKNRLNLDGSQTYRSRLADLGYWGHLYEDGHLRNAEGWQRRRGRLGYDYLEMERKRYCNKQGVPYVPRAVLTQPAPPPSRPANVVEKLRVVKKIFINGYTGKARPRNSWNDIRAALKEQKQPSPDRPPAYTTESFFDGVLVPFFGNVVSEHTLEAILSCRLTDVTTYLWSPAEYLQHISAAFILCMAGLVPGQKPPRSTWTHPHAAMITSSITSDMRNLYEKKQEWLTSHAVQEVMANYGLIHEAGIFWRKDEVLLNLAELMVNGGRARSTQSLVAFRNMATSFSESTPKKGRSKPIVDTSASKRKQLDVNDSDLVDPPHKKGRSKPIVNTNRNISARKPSLSRESPPRPAPRNQSSFTVFDEGQDDVNDVAVAPKRPMADLSIEVNKPKRRLINRKHHEARNEVSDDDDDIFFVGERSLKKGN